MAGRESKRQEKREGVREGQMEYEWERERETGDWERVGRDGENDIGKREGGMWGRLYEGNG